LALFFLILAALTFVIEKIWVPFRNATIRRPSPERREVSSLERQRLESISKQQEQFQEKAIERKKQKDEEDLERKEKLMEESSKRLGIYSGHKLREDSKEKVENTSLSRGSRRKNATQLLREEQDVEFQMALEMDIRKEQAEILRKQKEQEGEIEKQRIEFNKQEEKQQKLNRIPKEPSPQETDGVCSVVIRLPNGTRCGRRFYTSDKIQAMLDFASTRDDCELKPFQLVTPVPRTVFSNPNQTIGESGISSKTVLIVEDL